MKPGLHKFAIFDPISERAFVKEVVIDLNNEMIACPELPYVIPPEENPTKNIWKLWKDDTGE